MDKEKIDETALERQKVMNRIIAAGLNSLSHCIIGGTGSDKELLDTFVSKDFQQILPCWDLLNDQIKFHIFKVHIKSFEKFMRGEGKGDE